MKAPVNIDALMEEWSADSKVDETEPGRELSKISSLHAKYLRILTHHNLVCKKLQNEYLRVKKIKWEYYTGDLNNPEDLEAYKLPPLMKKILRQDIPIYLDSDTELNTLLMKKSLHQEIVDFCGSVLKELNNRTFQMNNLIKWEMFTSGG
jgi:hypothetical protein